ncbi:MAG: acyltransferase [Anaerolineales bacterium]
MTGKASTRIIRAKESRYPQAVWKFTNLDRACLPMVLRGTWIFEGRPDIERMQAGLEILLGQYPHLAGRIDGTDGIRLANGGVPFAVADSSGRPVSALRQGRINRREFSTGLSLSRVKGGRDAPLSVKVTRLADGYVVGIQCSHACLDGNSFYKMADNWGRICRGADFERPVLEQGLLPEPQRLTRREGMRFALDNGWVKLSTLKFLRLLPLFASGILKERTDAFPFSAEALERLKREFAARLGFPCSANVALSALLTKMCMRLAGVARETACTQITVANGRGHLEGIPEAFAGNASTFVITPSFPGDSAVEDIARIIHDALAPKLKTPSPEMRRDLLVSLALIPLGLPVGHVDLAEMYARPPTLFQINNFSKLPAYGVDFGAGRPVRAVPHDLADPILIWPAHPSQGGVEVYFGTIFARMIGRLRAGDPWMGAMREYGRGEGRI